MTKSASIHPKTEYVEEIECGCRSLRNEGAAYIFAIRHLAPAFVMSALFEEDDDGAEADVDDAQIQHLARYVTLDLLRLLLPGTRRFAQVIRALEPSEDTWWESMLDRLMEGMREYNEGETGTVQATNPLMSGVVAVVDDVVDTVLYRDPDADPRGERPLMRLDEPAWIDRVAEMLARGISGDALPPGAPLSPPEHDETVHPQDLRDIAQKLYTIRQTAEQSAAVQVATRPDINASASGSPARSLSSTEIRFPIRSRSQPLNCSRQCSPERERQTQSEPADADRVQVADFSAAEAEIPEIHMSEGTGQCSEVSQDTTREQSGESGAQSGESGESASQSREQTGTSAQDQQEESGYESEEEGVEKKKTSKRRKMHDKDTTGNGNGNGNGKDDKERPSKRRRT